MKDQWIGPCACIGRQNGEPYCNCLMERNNIPRSHAHKVEQERIARELPAALEAFFAKKAAKKEGA